MYLKDMVRLRDKLGEKLAIWVKVTEELLRLRPWNPHPIIIFGQLYSVSSFGLANPPGLHLSQHPVYCVHQQVSHGLCVSFILLLGFQLLLCKTTHIPSYLCSVLICQTHLLSFRLFILPMMLCSYCFLPISSLTHHSCIPNTLQAELLSPLSLEAHHQDFCSI